MKVKVAQKSSTEPFESAENDLKIKNVNVHKTIEKSMKKKTLIFEVPKANWKLRFASEKLLASDFEALEVSWTPRGDQGSLKEVSKSSKKRPGEPQGGLQELQSYDPWNLSSDYEPSRSRWLPPKSSQGAS